MTNALVTPSAATSRRVLRLVVTIEAVPTFGRLRAYLTVSARSKRIAAIFPAHTYLEPAGPQVLLHIRKACRSEPVGELYQGSFRVLFRAP